MAPGPYLERMQEMEHRENQASTGSIQIAIETTAHFPVIGLCPNVQVV
jgi:hypothetical protein